MTDGTEGPGLSILDGLGRDGEDRRPRRQWMHAATTIGLTVIIGLAVADGLDWIDVYGVDTARVQSSGGGYDLDVRYATVSRPALATPFEIVVTRPGGFDAPVTVAVSRSYLALWDENGLAPAPAAETTRDAWIEWEFDPPPGESLTIVYDARIEPGAQSGRDGVVAVIEDDQAVVQVEFHTAVRP